MLNPNEFVESISNIAKFDKAEMLRIIQLTIKYYSGNKAVREQLKENKKFELDWYESLKTGKPNYSIYDEVYMLADYYACFVCYSNKYLNMINKIGGLKTGQSIIKDINTNLAVVDLGCGISYTTIKLKQLLPQNNVYGTNFKDSLQYKYGKFLSSRNNINIVSSITEITEKIGVVFASEYFEHIYSPIDHLKEILNTKPKYLIIANSFSSISMGHFPNYKYNGEIINNKKIGRLFNNTLRGYGYENVETNFWNSRPTYWRLKTNE